MIEVSDKFTAQTSEHILGDSIEIAYSETMGSSAYTASSGATTAGKIYELDEYGVKMSDIEESGLTPSIVSADIASKAVADMSGNSLVETHEMVVDLYNDQSMFNLDEKAPLSGGTNYSISGTGQSYKLTVTNPVTASDNIVIGIAPDNVSKTIAVTPGSIALYTMNITGGSTGSGNLTITLNGKAFTVAIANNLSAEAVATEICKNTFDGYTASQSNANILFYATTKRPENTCSFSAGSTAVVATIVCTTAGAVGQSTKEALAAKIGEQSYTGFTTSVNGATVVFTRTSIGKNPATFTYTAGSTGSAATIALLKDGSVSAMSVVSDVIAETQRCKGIHICFTDVDGGLETWQYTGTTINNATHWAEDGSKKFTDLLSEVVYDISAAHDGQAYADLTAALGTNGSNLPESVRKGGVSVRFVQSGENKYVQYLFHDTSTAVADFTNTSNWEKVNLEKELTLLSEETKNVLEAESLVNLAKNFIEKSFIKANGDFDTSNSFYRTDYIPVTYGDLYRFISTIGNSSAVCLAEYDQNHEFVSNIPTNGGTREEFYTPSNSSVAYIAISSRNDTLCVFIDVTDTLFTLKRDNPVTEIEKVVLSNNLADFDNIVEGELIASNGNISTGTGWAYVKVDVSHLNTGDSITFGGFYLGRTAWYAFYSVLDMDDRGKISYALFADPNGTTTPKTVTKPAGAKWLLIDIKTASSPSNPYSGLMVNRGTTLKTQDTYNAEVEKINGLKIYGTGGAGIETLIVDLPVSDGTDIQSGYAYIDSTDRCVKVKA